MPTSSSPISRSPTRSATTLPADAASAVRTAPAAGVAILAGGEATRLPAKLLLDAGGVPLLVRVYRNVGLGRETLISSAASFPSAVDDLLPVPLVVDRRPGHGPLGGLVSTLGRMRSRWVFVVAGDAPFAGSALLERLEAARRPGDEAVVPVRDVAGRPQLEPLAALYDRPAFLCAAAATLRAGRGSVRAVVERLRTRRLAVDDPLLFTNINTPADYAAFRGEAQESAAEHGTARRWSARVESGESPAEHGATRRWSARVESGESPMGGSGGRVPPYKGEKVE